VGEQRYGYFVRDSEFFQSNHFLRAGIVGDMRMIDESLDEIGIHVGFDHLYDFTNADRKSEPSDIDLAGCSLGSRRKLIRGCICGGRRKRKTGKRGPGDHQ
jgi:hypothetical protein